MKTDCASGYRGNAREVINFIKLIKINWRNSMELYLLGGNGLYICNVK